MLNENLVIVNLATGECYPFFSSTKYECKIVGVKSVSDLKEGERFTFGKEGGAKGNVPSSGFGASVDQNNFDFGPRWGSANFGDVPKWGSAQKSTNEGWGWGSDPKPTREGWGSGSFTSGGEGRGNPDFGSFTSGGSGWGFGSDNPNFGFTSGGSSFTNVEQSVSFQSSVSFGTQGCASVSKDQKFWKRHKMRHEDVPKVADTGFGISRDPVKDINTNTGFGYNTGYITGFNMGGDTNKGTGFNMGGDTNKGFGAEPKGLTKDGYKRDGFVVDDDVSTAVKPKVVDLIVAEPTEKPAEKPVEEPTEKPVTEKIRKFRPLTTNNKGVTIRRDDTGPLFFGKYLRVNTDPDEEWRFTLVKSAGFEHHYVYTNGVFYHWVEREDKRSSYGRDPSMDGYMHGRQKQKRTVSW